MLNSNECNAGKKFNFHRLNYVKNISVGNHSFLQKLHLRWLNALSKALRLADTHARACTHTHTHTQLCTLRFLTTAILCMLLLRFSKKNL